MKGGIFLEPKYKRVIIKLSGEALAGSAGHGINTPTVQSICSQIKEVFDLGVEIAIVVGGGNFWRGRSGEGMDKSTADFHKVNDIRKQYRWSQHVKLT